MNQKIKLRFLIAKSGIASELEESLEGWGTGKYDLIGNNSNLLAD